MRPMSRVDGRIFWAALICRPDNFGREWVELAETQFWLLHGLNFVIFHFQWLFLITKMIINLTIGIFLDFGRNRPIRPSDLALFHVSPELEGGVLQKIL